MCTDPPLRRPCFHRGPCFISSCVLIRVQLNNRRFRYIVTSQECVKCHHVQCELTRVSPRSLQAIIPVEPVGAWYPRNPRVPTVLCGNQSNLKQEQKDCSTAAEPPEGLNGHTHTHTVLISSAQWGPELWPSTVRSCSFFSPLFLFVCFLRDDSNINDQKLHTQINSDLQITDGPLHTVECTESPRTKWLYVWIFPQLSHATVCF